ncbi:MAG: four helix bundle protein [Deltaproteobacteria bacterium]|nr:four helix bundle protein [Deltaproteobacteria bacterium]
MAIALAGQLRGPLEAVRRRDRSLEDQVRRAATSVALNLAESTGRDGADRVRFIRIAAGSLCECRAGLEIAKAWGFVEPRDLVSPLALASHIEAILYKLRR